MAILNDVKVLLGNPDGLDDKLNAIIDITEKRLEIKLGKTEVPTRLEYIVTEVAVIRYNRIGSEGVSSHSVEGESLSFNDDDFSAYQDDIEAYLNSQDDETLGRIRFL
jgi:hypothetical protein